MERLFRGSWASLAWLLFLTLGLQGCATYSQNMAPIRAALISGTVPQAVEQFNKVKASKDDLTYLLQKGYLSHLSGDWQDSNSAFDDAEKRYEELYTVSISNEAFSLLTSDTVRPYRSNDQEIAMIPYYRIFNYVQLGRTDDALVEARKANNNHPVDLSQLKKMSEKDLEYKAFLNYYTGLLYASQGESNDSIVSLRNAYKLYRFGNSNFGIPLPLWLPADYYDAALGMGLKDESRELSEAYPSIDSQAQKNRHSNVVLFLESGFVPYRQGVDIFLPLLKKDDSKPAEAHTYYDRYSGNIYNYQTQPAKLDQFLRISFPKLLPYPNAVASVEVALPYGGALSAEPGLNLAKLTYLQFKQDSGDIFLRTLLRTLAKQGTLKAAQGQSEGLGWLMNTFNVITEQADTRSWLLLPERIDMVKMAVPNGVSTITVRFRGANGAIVEEKQVSVNPTEKLQWISVRCFK